jgi:hypothetical protein
MRAAALLVALLCSCGAAPLDGPASFSTRASQVVTSVSGALQLQVFEQVDRPVSRGVNALRLGVWSSEAGAGVPGLTLTVTPWMPVMGHGSAVLPTVTPDEGGFIIEDLSLPMPGQWELRCTFEGPVTDHALVHFDLQ